MTDDINKAFQYKSTLINQVISQENKLKELLSYLVEVITDTTSDIEDETGSNEISVDKEFVLLSKGNDQIEFSRNGSNREILIENQEDLDESDWVINDMPRLIMQVKLIADTKEFLQDYRHISRDYEEDWYINRCLLCLYCCCLHFYFKTM